MLLRRSLHASCPLILPLEIILALPKKEGDKRDPVDAMTYDEALEKQQYEREKWRRRRVDECDQKVISIFTRARAQRAAALDLSRCQQPSEID